jgi:hypothetical protein
MNTIEKTKTKVMKKEKITKVTPTQEQVDKMVLDYLNSCEKHYFQARYVWDKEFKEDYYKVFSAKIDGKLYCVTILVEDGSARVKFVDTSLVTTKNQLGMMKNNIFGQEMKHKSLKPSVEMKVKFSIIKNFIESSTDIGTLKIEIEKILK